MERSEIKKHIERLKDEDWEVRIKAAQAIGMAGPNAKEAVSALIEALRDENLTVRWRAAHAIGRIGPSARTAVPALRKALKDKSLTVRWRAAHAIGRIGPSARTAVPALRKALKDKSLTVRWSVIMALWLTGYNDWAAADIGCGAGRYSLQFLQHLGLHHLACIDVNESMLGQVSSMLKATGLANFRTIESAAERIPLVDNSIDYIFTFNAIHHFDFVAFMQEAARIVGNGGSIIIYTRLRSQNAENIWGKHFPLFLAKEDRLYEMDELEQMIKPIPALNIQCVKQFRYLRTASLGQLLNLARNRHYSTFSLYEKEEFASALEGFQRNITRHFSDPEHVKWFDEYTMLVVSRS